MIRPGQIGERRMTRWFYQQRKSGFEAQTNSRVCRVRPSLREKYSVTTQHFASITQFADTSWTEYKIKFFPFTSHTSLGISWKTSDFMKPLLFFTTRFLQKQISEYWLFSGTFSTFSDLPSALWSHHLSLFGRESSLCSSHFRPFAWPASEKCW